MNAVPSNALANKRILIAEDESLIALELETILLNFGCDVVGPVARPGDALAQAQQGGIDGALLDVNLRGEQIFSILPQLTALGLPFIITSGYNDATLFPAAFRDYPRIAKPFDERTLFDACVKVFARGA